MKRSVKMKLRAVLVVCLVVAICGQLFASVSRESMTVVDIEDNMSKCYVVAEDGSPLEIVFQASDPEMSSFTASVRNLITGKETVASYSDGILTETNYDRETNGKSDSESVLTNTRVYDIAAMSDAVKEAAVTSAGYKKKVWLEYWEYKASDGKKYNHYYAIGNSGDQLGHALIGCVRHYYLATDAPYFNDYKKQVDASNQYMIKAFGNQAGAAVLAAAMLLVPIGAPVAVIIALVSATTGSEVGVVNNVYNSYHAFQLADDYFDMAKAYGVRVE